jgi:hypothetical protein
MNMPVDMRKSTTYQRILREGRLVGVIEGRIEEARRLLFRHGTQRFFNTAPNNADIRTVQDIDRLEALGERILNSDISEWDGLLREPWAESPLKTGRSSSPEPFWSWARFTWEVPAFQAILWEGRLEGVITGRIDAAHRFLLHHGTKRFGEPDAATVTALEAIQEIDRLEAPWRTNPRPGHPQLG